MADTMKRLPARRRAVCIRLVTSLAVLCAGSACAGIDEPRLHQMSPDGHSWRTGSVQCPGPFGAAIEIFACVASDHRRLMNKCPILESVTLASRPRPGVVMSGTTPYCDGGDGGTFRIGGTQTGDRPSADTLVCSSARSTCPGCELCRFRVIDVTSGASRTERLTERDFVGRGPFPLSFERTYDSSELQRASGSAGSLGTRWWHGFERALVHYRSGTADYALLYRPAEGVFSFREDAGTWRAIADAPGRLERIPVAGTSGWRYTAGHEGIEIYESTGRLLSVARAGVTQTLTYSNGDATRYPATAPACKPPAGSSTPTKGRLWCVTDSLGLQLNFAYDLRSLLTKLVSPRGTEVSYAYDAGLLTSVTSKTVAGARMRIYQYPDPPCPGKPSGRAAAGSTC